MPPATPTTTPRAHPLAPNPTSSIGLFWIYTDANTGRQWTGGTYKVKRCTGTSCTPTSVIASGLTSADYQDTGLDANTTYGYRYVANDGTDSGDSPTVYVTTTATDDNMVHFPAGAWADLLGPQPEAGQIPFTWYNSTATSIGQTVISMFPRVGPAGKLQGTGSINNGSTTLTGSGTKFLEQVSASNPSNFSHIAINGVDAGVISSVDSNTQITLVTSWAGSNQSGVNLSTNVGGIGAGADPLNDYLVGNQLMYYDSPMALWQLYFRTGDPQYLRGAIKGSEAIFAGYMWLGRNRAWGLYSTTANEDDMPAPRNFQFSGYLLLGLAGHDGVWDLLDKYLTARYPTWISNYRGGNHNFTYPREKAYMTLFTTWFVMAAPDSFPRSDGTVTSLNGATTVDGSIATGRKGYWKGQLDTDVPGFITDDQWPMGFWLDIGGSNSTGDGDYPYWIETPELITGPGQPFIQGLMADSLGYCWRNTSLATATRNAARKCVLKSAAAIGHIAYCINFIPNNPTIRHRTLYYFNEGGTRLNPYAFQHGADIYVIDNIPYSNSAKLNRESNPLALSTFGWAWEMSGDTWYKNQGLEMMNASFAEIGENTGGTGDGLKSLADNTANYKDFGQCYRTTGRAYGHYLQSPSTLDTPPSVTMPGNQTLTGGVNQVELTASVSSANTPLSYRWVLKEFALINNPRHCAQPVFTAKDSLTTKLCGLEPGTYKILFYALDNLGLQGSGTVTITVGDGVFPPTGAVGYGNPPAEEMSQYLTTSSSLSCSVKANSLAGRSLSHSLVATWPKDKSAPTITPSSGTGTSLAFSVSSLSAGLWSITDTITDSAGAVRKCVMYIRHTAESQPSSGHNTIPTIAVCPNHILPAGSTSTRLYVVPLDPEGIATYDNTATGYFIDMNGSKYLVGPLTHSWTQQSGPATATITNGDTVRPDITNMSTAGTYTFRYTGTDQQSDTVTADITVTTQTTIAGNPRVRLIAISM